MLVQHCWRLANTWQRDSHSWKPETFFVHWATRAASPRQYITWGNRSHDGRVFECQGIPLRILRIRKHLGLPRGYPYSFELLAQATKGRGATNKRFNSWQQPRPYGFVLASARAQLGDLAFELAWSKGATMTTEQAIALALS